MPDLDNRREIHDLVVRFYREIAFDDLLGPVFIETAEVDWSVHIPKLIDYWCRVLLGHPGYDGSLLLAHRQVHDIEAFRSELFDRWYLLFVDTVDDAWRGPIAERAKTHAARIAGILARQLLDVAWTVPATSSSIGG
jgi:hemoglobin